MKAPGIRELKKVGIKDVIGQVKDLRDGQPFALTVLIGLGAIQNANYQRGVCNSHVEKMKREYDPRACNELILSYRPCKDGAIWNVDGRQRQNMLMRLNFHETYARLHFGMTYEQEAQLFFRLNQAPKKMGGWVKFKAAVNAGNDIYLALMGIADKYRLTTPQTPGVTSTKYADIKSPSVLLFPFNRGGLGLTDSVCRVLDRCWREGRSRNSRVIEGATELRLIQGLTSFLENHLLGDSPLPWSTIEMVLRKCLPSDVAELASKQKAKGRIDQRQYYDAFCELFGKSKVKITPLFAKAA